MTEIQQTIICNIKDVCKVKKIKNKDIAQHMGVSEGSVSNWFTGKNFLDVDNLYVLCLFLGVSLDQIFGIKPIVYGVMSEQESFLLESYRKANPAIKCAVDKLLDIDRTQEDTESKII